LAYKVATSADDLDGATKIILPGVGAFDQAALLLNESGMRETLDTLVLQEKIPVLGVCVGMQLMASSSEEGTMPGLGWVEATVKKFPTTTPNGATQLPHMGWNAVTPTSTANLFSGEQREWSFYFLHSYFFECKYSDNVLAMTTYDSDFTSALESENIFGAQFHPEKSHAAGVQLLNNFGLI
jgi:imidazole glycerol-phosphate synthase subunit HisH